MKILFKSTGEIIEAIYNKDWFSYSGEFTCSFNVFEIDEVDPENKDICIDLVKSLNRVDINGNAKYYMSFAIEWVLNVVDGWVEHQEEI